MGGVKHQPAEAKTLMACIQNGPTASGAHGTGTTGREHSRHFDRKQDAQAHLDKVTASLLAGTFVDPKSGKVTLASFFDDWSSRQVWAPATLSTARNAV